jgi:hypothetical protein
VRTILRLPIDSVLRRHDHQTAARATQHASTAADDRCDLADDYSRRADGGREAAPRAEWPGLGSARGWGSTRIGGLGLAGAKAPYRNRAGVNGGFSFRHKAVVPARCDRASVPHITVGHRAAFHRELAALSRYMVFVDQSPPIMPRLQRRCPPSSRHRGNRPNKKK